MTDEMLNTLRSVQSNAIRLTEEITADQWTLPTPCTEWNVAQLVNHITGSVSVLADAATGATDVRDPNDDHSGDDPIGALRAATEKSWKVWNTEGATEGMVSVPFEMPASACLGITILDAGTHVWDLATAIGGEHGLTSDDIQLIDQLNRQSINDQARASGAFGEPLDPGDDAPLTTMLAFVGRSA